MTHETKNTPTRKLRYLRNARIFFCTKFCSFV